MRGKESNYAITAHCVYQQFLGVLQSYFINKEVGGQSVKFQGHL